MTHPGEAARSGHVHGNGHTAGVFRHEVILQGDGAAGFVSQTAPVAEQARERTRRPRYPCDVEELEGELIEPRPMQPLVAMAGISMIAGSYNIQAARPFDGRLDPAPEHAESMRFDESGLPALRRAVTVWADSNCLGRESIEELVLAVDEIATNSIRYGGGEGMLRMWRAGEMLLCEVADRGHMKDPLLGRVRPGADALSGRGLWIVNHLCDLVQISSSAQGSQVRMHKKLA